MLYQTCMDTETVEERSLVELQEIISRELGGWPVVEGEQWVGDVSWTELSVRAAQTGLEADTILSCGIPLQFKEDENINFLLF